MSPARIRQHNPGAFEAVRLGCRCSPLRNQHGRGAGETLGLPWFDVAPDCAIHHAGWLRTTPVDDSLRGPEPKRTPELNFCGTCGSKRRGPGAAGRPSTCCTATRRKVA